MATTDTSLSPTPAFNASTVEHTAANVVTLVHKGNIIILVVYLLLVIVNGLAHLGLGSGALLTGAGTLSAYFLGSFYSAGKHAAASTGK